MIEGLSNPVTGSVERQQKGMWLEDFGKSPIAWNVAVELLARGQHQVYAAALLTKKISTSWSSLQKEHKKELCDVVLSMIGRENCSSSLAQTLAVTVTHIIIQSTPHDWPDPVTDTLYLAQPAPDAPIDTRSVWISFARHLATEIAKPAPNIPPDQHQQLKDYLKNVSADVVIRTLLEIINNHCTDQSSPLAGNALVALQPWFQMSPATSPTTLLAYQVVIDSILTSPDTLLDAGAEVLNDISSVFTLPQHPQTIVEMLALVLKLGPLLPVALETEDEEAVLRLLTSFSSIGINLTSVLLDQPEMGVELSSLIVQCCTVKEALASEAFDYWDALQDSIEQHADFDDLLDLYRPAMQDMVRVMIGHCRESISEEEPDVGEQQELRELRNRCCEVLLKFYTIIQEEELEILYELLQTSIQEYERQPSRDVETWIEVALWGWASLSEDFDEEEEWPQKLMRLFGSLPTTSMLIQRTSLHLISSLAHWFALHSQTLPLALSHIVNALENPELANAATEALSWVGEECAELLPPLLGDILDQLGPVMSALTPNQQCRVISCLANQVTYLEPSQGLNLLVQLAGDLPASLVTLTRETNQFNLLQRGRLIDGMNFICELMVSPGEPMQRDEQMNTERRVSRSAAPPRLTANEKYMSQIEWAQVALVPLVDQTWEIAHAIINGADLDEPMCMPVLKYLSRVVGALKRYVFASYLPRALELLCLMFRRTCSVKVFKPYEHLSAIYRCTYNTADLSKMPEGEVAHLQEMGLLLHVATSASTTVAPLIGGIPGTGVMGQDEGAMQSSQDGSNQSALAELPPGHIVHTFFEAFSTFTTLCIEMFSSGTNSAEEIELIQFYYHCCASSTILWLPRTFFYDVSCVVMISRFAVGIITALQRIDEVKLIRTFLTRLFTTDVSRVMMPADAAEFQSFKEVLYSAMFENILLGIAGESPRSIIPAIADMVHHFLVLYPQMTPSVLESLLSRPGFPNETIDMERKRAFLGNIIRAIQSPNKMANVLQELAVVCRGIESTFLAGIHAKPL